MLHKKLVSARTSSSPLILTMENKIGMKDLTGWLKFAAIGAAIQAVLLAIYIGVLLAAIVIGIVGI